MGLLASCLSMLAVAAVPAPKLLDAGELRTGVFDREGVESSTEISEAGRRKPLISYGISLPIAACKPGFMRLVQTATRSMSPIPMTSS